MRITSLFDDMLHLHRSGRRCGCLGLAFRLWELSDALRIAQYDKRRHHEKTTAFFEDLSGRVPWAVVILH